MLINSAAVTVFAPIELLDDAAIDLQIETNIVAPLHLTRAFVPHFREPAAAAEEDPAVLAEAIFDAATSDGREACLHDPLLIGGHDLDEHDRRPQSAAVATWGCPRSER